MKFKSFGIIAICALSFTFMSFSASDGLYGEAYYVPNQPTADSIVDEVAWVGAAVRFTAAATRAAVNYTRAAARAACPHVEHAIAMASTWVIANQLEMHQENYAKSVEVLKKQRINDLG